MLQKGDLVPHFTVRTAEGEIAHYDTYWQRRDLVLLLTGSSGEARAASFEELLHRIPEFTANGAVCIVTADPIAGLTSPAVVVADQWGEIVCLAQGAELLDFRGADEVLRCLHYLEIRCPECEGEAR